MIVGAPETYPWGQVVGAAKRLGLAAEARATLVGLSVEGYANLYPNHILGRNGLVERIDYTICDKCGHSI